MKNVADKKRRPPRVILFSGKGGVGKTTVACATGMACAERGLKTLVMSIDIAHSLSDAFDLPVHLLDTHQGLPVKVHKKLYIQEIDLQNEIDRHWGELRSSLSLLMKSGGVNGVLSEELATIPGMDDVICLLYINKYIEEGTYDVIILDSAPTGESLRFISMPTTIEWYMQKLYKLKGSFARIAAPLMKIMGNKKEDGELGRLQELYKQLGSIREILVNSEVTSVRLVCNPERMVVNETLRAYMYFCLYGMTVDMVVINRVLPDEANNGYFDEWLKEQNKYLEQIENHFAPARVVKSKLFPTEISGKERLGRYSKELFDGFNPEDTGHADKPYEIISHKDHHLMKVKLPGAGKEHVDLLQEDNELIIRIGNFKRHVYLPRPLSGMKSIFAKYKDGYLTIRFENENVRERASSAAEGSKETEV
ncbi:MAG: TRC40/GET3/ArsA family transport-energizing ATPase [Nitrospinota bacterium]